MNTWYFLAAFSMGSLVIPIQADPPSTGSEREEVVKFLKANVIGKTLEVTIPTKIDKGKVEAEFYRRTSFCNLMELQKGFQFDEVCVIRQTNFDLDANGKRIGAGRNLDRTVIVHWQVGERLSTGRLIGNGIISLNTAVSAPGEFSTLQMKLENNKLVMIRSTGMYGDFFAAENKFKPGASDTLNTFSVIKGKLQRVSTVTAFEVDPVTLKRTATGEISTPEDKEPD